MKPVVVGYTYYGKPYVIGEAPGPTPGLPLSGARTRIGKLIGRSAEEMAELFIWRNLLDRWPGYGPSGGSAFPMEVAKQEARHLLAVRHVHAHVLTPPQYRRLILLGKRVAAAFSHNGDWFEWVGETVVTPHPSGLNRFWNDPANVERARAFWKEAAAT